MLHQGVFFHPAFTMFSLRVLLIRLRRSGSMKTMNTGSGDFGFSSPGNGIQLSKSSSVFDALGNLDELSCQLGLVRNTLPQSDTILREIQKTLHLLGAAVSGNGDRDTLESGLRQALADMDEQIRSWAASASGDFDFILPGDHPRTARIELARAVCRRMERSFVDCFSDNVDSLHEAVLAYTNRLSRFLFDYARSLES